jgi:hypothetical protein
VRGGTQLRVGMLWSGCTGAEVPVAKRHSTQTTLIVIIDRHDSGHQGHANIIMLLIMIITIIIVIAFV